jgi:citrate lyase beta subunit
VPVTDKMREEWREERAKWIEACRQAGRDISLLAEIVGEDISDEETFIEMTSMIRRIGIAGSVEAIFKK